MKKKNVSKRKATIIAAAALAVITAMGATSLAYLTDSESTTNVTTNGKVQIDLVETAYDAAAKAGENLLVVPNQEISMDPMLKNTGNNPAIVYLKVSVPVKEVTKVADNGIKGTRENREIVYFKDDADAITAHANNFDSEWVQLSDKETGTALDGDTRTYVFGYKKAIAKDEETTKLFDKVQIMNVLEGDLTPHAVENIKIEAYAVQKDNIIKDEGKIDSSNLDAATLGEVYDIAFNEATMGTGAAGQNNDAQTNIDSKNADTSGSKDLAGQDL